MKSIIKLSIALFITSVSYAQVIEDTIYFNSFNTSSFEDSVLTVYAFSQIESSDTSFDGTGLIAGTDVDNNLNFNFSSLNFTEYDSIAIIYNLYTRGINSAYNLPFPSPDFGTFDLESQVSFTIDKLTSTMFGYYERDWNGTDEIYIDNLRIVGYKKDITTGVNKKQFNSKQIVKAYDIKGNLLELSNLPTNTLIILIDSNNNKEKVFYDK